MPSERNYRLGGIGWPPRPSGDGSGPPRRGGVPWWAWVVGLLVLVAVVPAVVQNLSPGFRAARAPATPVAPATPAAPAEESPAEAADDAPVVSVETRPENEEPEQTADARGVEAPRQEAAPAPSAAPAPAPASSGPAPRVTRSSPPATPSPRRERRVERTEPRREPRVTRRAAAPRRGESARSLNARAYRLQKQGRHAEAERLLRRAVELDPSYAYAQYNLGHSLVAQKKASQALKPLQTTARQQPNRWEPQQRLGEAYEMLGQKEKAEAAYARARQLRGGRASSRSARARTQPRRAAAAKPVAVRPDPRETKREAETRKPVKQAERRADPKAERKATAKPQGPSEPVVYTPTVPGPTVVDENSVLRPAPEPEKIVPTIP